MIKAICDFNFLWFLLFSDSYNIELGRNFDYLEINK